MMYFTNEQIDEFAKGFKGWDWAEVYEALDLPHDVWVNYQDACGFQIRQLERDEISEFESVVGNAINDLCRTHYQKKDLSPDAAKVLSTCRGYVRAVANLENHSSYLMPVWQGLDKVEDDESFLNMFSVVHRWMWD